MEKGMENIPFLHIKAPLISQWQPSRWQPAAELAEMIRADTGSSPPRAYKRKKEERKENKRRRIAWRNICLHMCEQQGFDVPVYFVP